MGLSPADLRRSTPAVRAADVLIYQLEIPVETTLEAFRIAKAAKVTTILNPAPAAALPDELLKLCDLCVPNETETQSLTGRPVTTVEEAAAAGRILLRRGPRVVIITLGARSCSTQGLRNTFPRSGSTRSTLPEPAMPSSAIWPSSSGKGHPCWMPSGARMRWPPSPSREDADRFLTEHRLA